MTPSPRYMNLEMVPESYLSNNYEHTEYGVSHILITPGHGMYSGLSEPRPGSGIYKSTYPFLLKFLLKTRTASLYSSEATSTQAASAIASNHWCQWSGVVPKAVFSTGM